MSIPRRHLRVVEREPEHREGDWEAQRARRARDLGAPPPPPVVRGATLVRERLSSRRFSDVVNAGIVDRPVRPTSPAAMLLWALLFSLAFVGAVAVAGILR